MKRIKAIVLLCALAVLCAGCIPEIYDCTGDTSVALDSDETAETSVTTEVTETAEETPVSSEVSETAETERAMPEAVFDRGSGDYHVPELTLNSIDANEINQDISSIYESIQNDSHYNSSKYIPFLTDDGIMSIVFVENGDWDDDIYHVYVININNGSRLTNEQIAEAAGVSDITEAATTGLENFLDFFMPNWRSLMGTDDYRSQLLEDTFSEERLNDDMMIGLTDDSEMFFVSYVASQGGADYYYEIYDVNGNNLYSNDGWVN